MTFSGWVATVAGWCVTEIGRQPFIVYGLLRTADIASQVSAPMIGLTLALYVVVYTVLGAGLRGGAEVHGREARGGAGRPTRAERAATPAGVITPPVTQGALP